jgi:hypothetical protein
MDREAFMSLVDLHCRGHCHSLVELEVLGFAGIMDAVFPPLQVALMYIQFHLSFQVHFAMLVHIERNDICLLPSDM